MKKLTLNKKTKWAIGVAAALAGVYFLTRGKKAKAAHANTAAAPAPGNTGSMAAVGKNEKLTAKTFETRTTRRSGFVYAPAQIQADGTIAFTSPKAGFFTRVVYKNPAGQIFAEIR